MTAYRTLPVIIGLSLGIGVLGSFTNPAPRVLAQADKSGSVEQKLDDILKRLDNIEKKLGISPPVPAAPAAELRTLRAAASPLDDISGDDIFEGKHRKFPKTSIVHGGESKTFQDVKELIAFFESPKRKQEKWMGAGKPIQKSTNVRNEIELVNVTVKDAWIYEISRQDDNDYHLLIGVHPDRDRGRYLNAEISAINLESPDALALWQLRTSFKKHFETRFGDLPTDWTQPDNPIHIRIAGSIFLDADHGRRRVGHDEIKNFTSWEIHPITMIEILGD